MNGMAYDNGGLRSLHLFAGAGGGILADLLLGHWPICAVEIEDYPRRVLLQRQRDGILPEFPIWDDVQTFDGKHWRGAVDIVAGGFPCQDISAAGKGAGLAGERSGLWSEMARIVGEVRPRFVFVENSPLLISRGLDIVLGDLAALGYDAAWGIVGAHHAGAPHKRDRCWILADDTSLGRTQAAKRQEPKKPKPVLGGPTSRGPRKMADAGRGRCGESGGGEVQQSRRAEAVGAGEELADTDKEGLQGSQWGRFRGARRAGKFADGGQGLADAANEGYVRRDGELGEAEGSDDDRGSSADACGQWWATEPALGGLADGVAAVLDAHGADACESVGRVATGIRHRADRLKAIGNGQCPQAAAIAWRILEGLHHE